MNRQQLLAIWFEFYLKGDRERFQKVERILSGKTDD